MNPIKVSIIVPVFNTSQYLVKCIESILHQSLESIELILVNDNSTDPKDDEICAHYAKTDARVKYFINNTLNTNGPSSARNLGIQNATGDFFAFVDSDDWLKPEMYQKMYDAAITHHADTVQCGAMRVHDNAHMDQPFIAYNDTTILKGCDILDSVALPNLPQVNNTQTAIWNKLYRKSLILDNNIRFNTNLQMEDIEFTYQVAYHSNISVLTGDLFYQYYARKNSIIGDYSVDTAQKFIEVFESTKKFLIAKNSFNDIFSHQFYRQYFEYISLCNKNIARDKNKAKILKNIINITYHDDFLNTVNFNQIESILNPYSTNKYKAFSKLTTFKKILFLADHLKLKIINKLKKHLKHKA